MESNYEESSFTTSLMDSTPINIEAINTIIDNESMIDSFSLTQEVFTKMNMDSTTMNQEPINTVSKESFVTTMMESSTIIPETNNTPNKDSVLVFMENSTTILHEEVNKESSTRFMEYSTTNLQESIRLESSSRFLIDSTTLMQEVLNTDAITTTTTTLIKDEDSTSKLNELDIYSQTTETGEYSTLLSELLHGVPVSESEDLYTEYEDEEEDVFVSSTVFPTLIVQVPQSPVTNLSFEQIMINDSLVLYIHWGQSLKTTTVLSVQGDKIGKFETFSKGKNFTAEVSLSTCSVYTIELKLENDTLLQRLELLTPYENGKIFTPNDFKITTLENYSTIANWELDESFECISHYLFQIDNLTVVTTESFIVLSELLPLEHCQNYSVSLKAHNSTSEGFTTSFTYVEKRRSHRLEPLTSLISSISENSAVISLSSFDFSCSPIELVFENKSYFIPGFQDYSLESLNACTTYNVSLLNQAHEYLVTNFTTLGNKNEFKPLTPTDVIWTTFINGYKVHWPSRCSSDYKIEWGLINQSIKSESESEVNSVLLTPLLSCRKYEYKIFVEKFLLIQSTFDTDLNDDFKLELEAFEYSRNSESIHLKWTHVHSCITEYRIYLEEEGQEIERVSLNISAPSSLESLQTFIVFPQTCQNIKLKVYPIFSKYINYIYTTLALPFVQEIKKEEPRISGLIISNLTANSADVEWTSNLCSRNYTVSFKDVLLNVNTSKATLESLTPCTKYTVWVAFDSSIENNKLYSDINFTTKHETFIPVKALASFHEIVIDLESPYVDCVTAYVGKLSSHKTLYIRPSQKQFTFTFTELTSNTDYDYEIKGLNEHEDIIYFSSGRLQTMRRINHAFLFVKSIEESSLTLELNSSIYDEFKNPQFSISLMCFSDNKLILSQISKNTKTVILDKLETNSLISCSSNLTFMEESIRMRVIDVRTLDQVPKAPIYLRASNVTSHEVSLEWKTPSNFNGIITEHRIKISRLCDSKSECGKDCMEAKEMEFVSKNKTNAFSITSLESGTSYQIQIADKTSNPKLGKWSQELIITTRPGAPIYPPKILQTFTTSKDSVILDFEYPCPLTGETIFQVHVEKQGGLIKKQTHRRIFSKQVKARSFEVSGFEGGETYELFLEARVLNCSNCTSRSPSVVLSIKCRHRCKDGTCVHKHRNVTCDYIKDCFDGSDEMNCFCESPDKFLCSNGFCLRASQRCDGTPDCGDRSDEINCKHCSAHQFSCRSNGKCIHKKQTCDRHKDCPDGSDEFGCAYWKMSCWADQFRCLDKTCINVRKQCDGKWDCSFGEDERNCKFAHCKFTEFTCQSDHTCLPTHKYCNGIRDCSDGSDETFGCECHKDGKFACHDGLQCTERLRVCDGVTDCRDESDEFQCYSSSEKKYLNISSLSTSSEKETLSSTSTSNLIRSPVIDLTTPSYNSFSQNPNILPVTPEFSEYDDLEVGNLVMESKFNLKVYPKSQTVPFGGDAVIQCRDEGPLRANVIWRKGNQRYLRKDKRFNVKKGRLEIHKIRRRDRGYYFCVPENAEETNGISTFIEVTFRS